MNTGEVEILIGKYIDGAMDADEAAALLAEVEASTEARDLLARHLYHEKTIRNVDRALKASIEYAYANPDEVRPYIRAHAQEMDEAVMQQHIDLYVNGYTIDYGPGGEAAISDLLARAEAEGIVPGSDLPTFLS